MKCFVLLQFQVHGKGEYLALSSLHHDVCFVTAEHGSFSQTRKEGMPKKLPHHINRMKGTAN